MKEYKKIIYIFLFLGGIGLFLFYIPNIDLILRNKNIKKFDNNIENENQIPSKYNCTGVKYSDISVYDIITNNVVFKIDKNGNIKEYILTRTSTYSEKADFEKYKKEHTDKIDNGLNITVTSDDSILLITEKIALNNNLLVDKTYNEYPTKFEELKNYLNKEGYSCSKYN